MSSIDSIICEIDVNISEFLENKMPAFYVLM